jgi:hypothetical protein
MMVVGNSAPADNSQLNFISSTDHKLTTTSTIADVTKTIKTSKQISKIFSPYGNTNSKQQRREPAISWRAAIWKYLREWENLKFVLYKFKQLVSSGMFKEIKNLKLLKNG